MMRQKVVFFGVALLSAVTLFAQAPDTLWTKIYGDTGNDVADDIKQTSDGGYIVAGTTSSFGAGLTDFWLLKIDANGDTLWTKTYGGTGEEYCYYVCPTFDGGYVLGGYTSSYGAGGANVWLVKTDASGNLEWAKDYGTPGWDEIECVLQTPDSGYICAGSQQPIGDWDVWILRMDKNGDTVWTKIYGGTGDDWAISIDTTADGGFIITGDTWSFGAGDSDVWILKTDENGDTIWTKTYGGALGDETWPGEIHLTFDGGYVDIGRTYSFGAGGQDLWLIKTDENGDTLWAKAYGGTNNDQGSSVQQTADSGYILTGYLDNGASGWDAWLIRTDANGDTLWTKTFGGLVSDEGLEVELTDDGGYIVAGYTQSQLAGEWDLYLVKTEPDELSIKDRTRDTKTAVLNLVPNPAHDKVQIVFNAGWMTEYVALNIYDISGRLVKSFLLNPISAITWDCRDNAGTQLPSGIYFVEFVADDFTQTEKLLLLR